MSNFQFTADF